jgi:hypothetical protein
VDAGRRRRGRVGAWASAERTSTLVLHSLHAGFTRHTRFARLCPSPACSVLLIFLPLPQVTCEGTASFASNCYSECSTTGSCLYGLAPPYCDWCTKYGLQPKADGGYEGEGCGSSFCVKTATCDMIAAAPAT